MWARIQGGQARNGVHTVLVTLLCTSGGHLEYCFFFFSCCHLNSIVVDGMTKTKELERFQSR